MNKYIKVEQGYAIGRQNIITHAGERNAVGKISGDKTNSDRTIIRLEGPDQAITRIKSEYGGIRLLEEMLFELNLNLLRNSDSFNVDDYIERGKSKGCTVVPGYNLPTMPSSNRAVINYIDGFYIKQLRVRGEFIGKLTSEVRIVVEALEKRGLDVGRFGPRKESYSIY